MNRKADIKIAVQYDGAGAEKAKADLEEITNTTTSGAGERAEEPPRMEAVRESMEALAEATGELGEAAEETAAQEKALAGATGEQEAAAEDAAAQEEALRQYMELEAMTLKQLQAEMLRLAGARKQAAAAGDTVAYKKLSEEYSRCKSAMGQMSQQANIGKAAMMGQASAGMQFAQQLQSLGKQVASGSTDIAGMANQVMALGMALKAGLGPVGLLMGGMQALQAVLVNLDLSSVTKEMEKWPRLAKALDAISLGKTRKNIEELDAEMDAFWDELEESNEKLKELEKLDTDIALNSIKKQYDDYLETLEEVEKEKRKLLAERSAEENAQGDREKADAAAKLQSEKERLNTLRAAGEISEDDYRERIKNAAEEADTIIAGVEKAALLRKNREDVAQKQGAERIAEAMAAKTQELLKPYEGMLKLEMPSPEEWRQLQLRLDQSIVEPEDRARAAQIEEKANIIKKELAEAGIKLRGGTGDIVSWMHALQEVSQEQVKTNKALSERARNETTAARESKKAVEDYSLEQERRQDIRDEQERREDAEKAAADRMNEWAAVQERGYDEQAAWLESTMATLKRGSTEWAKWEQQAKNANKARIAEELTRMGKTYELSRSYAEQDMRTEEQQLRVDGVRLAAKRARLQQLLATPGLDAATQQRLNEELRATEKAQRGHRQVVEQTALAAQKSLEQYKQPQFSAKNKSMQGHMNRLAAAYARAARQAEKAASKGDLKGMERAQRGALSLAGRMVAAGANAQQVANETKRMFSNVKLVADNVKEGQKGWDSHRKETEAGKAELEKLKASIGGTSKAAANTARAESKVTAATEKVAAAKEKQAAAAKATISSAADGAARTEGRQIAEMQQSLTVMQQSLAAMQQSLVAVAAGAQAAAARMQSAADAAATLKNAQQQQLATVQQLAAAIGQVAATASANDQAMNRTIKKLEEQIQRMKRL